jgi:hypothetical protein
MKLRIYYKHSKRIAKEALKANLIKEKLYKELYTASFKVKKKRRNPKKECPSNIYFVYYKELHYLETDYWGEHDEVAIIDDIQQKLFLGLNLMTSHGTLGLKTEHFTDTLTILKLLRRFNASKMSWGAFVEQYRYTKYLKQKELVKHRSPDGITCAGYYQKDPSVHDFDCGFGSEFDCKECICNRGTKDPREVIEEDQEIPYA